MGQRDDRFALGLVLAAGGAITSLILLIFGDPNNPRSSTMSKTAVKRKDKSSPPVTDVEGDVA